MSKIIAPLLIVLAVVLVGVLGVFLLSNQNSGNSNSINLTPAISPTNAIINNPAKQASSGANTDNFKTMPSGLKIEDVATGTGTQVKSGDTVTVNYVGSLENGTKFDSSYDKNTPFTTQIGVGQVIKGWDEGIVGMKVGGKRRLIIPPALGYGEQEAGGVIPPNATLLFEVELLDVN